MQYYQPDLCVLNKKEDLDSHQGPPNDIKLRNKKINLSATFHHLCKKQR